MDQKIIKREEINFILKLPLAFDYYNLALYSLLREAYLTDSKLDNCKTKEPVVITNLFFFFQK